MTFYLVKLARPRNRYWTGSEWSDAKPKRLEFTNPIAAAKAARVVAVESDQPVSVIDDFDTAVLTVQGGKDKRIVRRMP